MMSSALSSIVVRPPLPNSITTTSSRVFRPPSSWLLIAACAVSFPFSGRARIQISGHPKACVNWAVEQLVTALHDSGIPEIEQDIVIECKRSDLTNESFSLSIDGSLVLITGSDSTGEMYGVLELAEQIANSRTHGTWSELVAHLTPTQQSPFLKFRADNSFLHEEPTSLARWAERLHIQHTPLLFEDIGMWDRYIDMLAANRFNTLDLHGCYNLVSTQFFNLLPALVAVPGYESVGRPRVQQNNLSALRHLIRYAGKRGVAVGLMNYTAEIRGLSHNQLVDYTKKAVAILQKEVPELKRLGFRVGESGEDLSFFKETYVQAILEAGRRDMRLYTRSWRTTPEEVESVADALGGKLDVEVKYNGEHLGLPYQGIFGPAHTRYGYQDFLRSGAHYHVLWQVRANGTHRYWTWAQTDFVRRAVRSFKFGGADGFTLEPQCAYSTNSAAAYYGSSEDGAVYKYIWEKHWPWYFAWGRLAYNPDLPTPTIVARYTRRFGEQGRAIYQALQKSGTVVPLVLSYRFTGPDQRNMSPETQTGAFDPEKDEPIDALSFARNTPMDSRSFVGIDEFVREKIAGVVDGRIGPAHMATLLASAARETRDLIAGVNGLTGRSSVEWRLMRTDLLAASYLGEYYSSRISGTMYLDHALRVKNRQDYDLAQQYLGRSRLAWGQLSQICDSMYAPLDDPMIGQSKYKWSSQISPLRALDATVAAMWTAQCSPSPAVGNALALTAREQGEEFDVTVNSVAQATDTNGLLTISCRPTPAAKVKKVTLWFKEEPSEAKWVASTMTAAANGGFTARIPKNERGYLCLLEITNTENSAAQFPPVLQRTPYWVLPQQGETITLN